MSWAEVLGDRVLREYPWDIFAVVMVSFEAAAFVWLGTHTGLGFDAGAASLSGAAGFVVGVVIARPMLNGIERNGEYRGTIEEALILGAIAIAVFFVIGVLIIYWVITGIVSLKVVGSMVIGSSASLPALFLGRLFAIRRWELAKKMEVHFKGFFLGTYYAIPTSSADEQLKY